MRIKLMLLGLIVGSLLGPIAVEASGGKVSVMPDPISLTEGGTGQIEQIQLDSPIICDVNAPTCDVTLNWTASDPTRVSINPATANFPANEWAQIRTFTVTALHDNIHDASNVVTISATVISSSIYYSGFAAGLTVNITDIDPVPAPVSAPVTTPTTTPVPTTSAPVTSHSVYVAPSKVAVTPAAVPTPAPVVATTVKPKAVLKITTGAASLPAKNTASISGLGWVGGLIGLMAVVAGLWFVVHRHKDKKKSRKKTPKKTKK